MAWNTPDNLKYTENDEWVLVEGTTAKLGLTDYAQDQLSDVVFVDLPDAGQTLDAGDACATVESVKAASDVYTPVSGEIVTVNSALDDSPDLINSDPYGAGWIIAIKMSDPGQLAGLMDAAAYVKHCADRSG